MRYIIPKSYVWDHYPPNEDKEMGNLLNLTHAVNAVLNWTQMYAKKFQINIPPPVRGTYERFFDFEKTKKKHH